ncbi:MAG: FecR family protein [Pedobacter sp.]|nr:MAG: FecR family protein [Pedobacter sp.]
MFENEIYIAQLVAARIKGTITEAQQAELDAWVNANERNTLQYQNYIDEKELDEKVKNYYSVNSAAIFQKITEGIKDQQQVVPVPKIVKLWPRIAISAAVVLVLFAGAWFLNSNSSGRKTAEIRYASDVTPGKIGATLTLANGKKILLSEAANGELVKEAGLTITKTAEGQLIYEIAGAADNSLNTLSTTKGETYQVQLPDGSKVWLNSASSLSYGTSLNEDGVRRVNLTGEAYFEVEKDAAHPFIVESGNQQVEVLGTEFNVNAYQDEKVFRTTLLKGSVKLSEEGVSTILVPGTQAANANGKIKLTKVDTELAVAWKNNKFIFDRLPIEEIMRMIARWYNLEVVYEGNIPSGTFWGSVSRFENVSKALVPLEATGNVHFKIEGRRIYVSD